MDGVKLHAKIYQTNTSHGKPIAMQLLLGLIGIPVGIIIGAMDTALEKYCLK